MTRFAFLAAASLALFVPAQAFAQQSDSGRYTMERTGEGFVRLHTVTGEMSICTEKSGQLVCRIAADERRAFEDSLSDLSARVAELEKRLDALAPGTEGGMPDDAELDRAIGAMEKMMRRFFGMVEDLRKEFDDPSVSPREPLPDRT